MKLSVSIVIYNHSWSSIQTLVESVGFSDAVGSVFLIDNSDKPLIENFPSKVEYIFNGKNLGYGAGHNIAIRKAFISYQYHLVLNPDIIIQSSDLEKILFFCEQQPHIGLVMPKVLYPDGSLQYLCKLIPTPFDLLTRRFIPNFLKSIFISRINDYELKHKSYEDLMEVPILSGCFMFLNLEALKYTGLFDERFFMYLEDTDLCRRINAQFKTVYYPEVSIVHNYEKGSYKSLRLLFYHISSAIKYFNKYGWFFDSVRTTINKLAVK